MSAPGLIIAAPASGAGKTTVTLALLAALAARGVGVQPFKIGPDYIDPAFHTAAAGRASVNLDGWAMGPGMLARLIAGGADAALIIAEAAMGLFDGAPATGLSGHGSAAELAALTGWPVVLVLDPAGQGATAGAVAHGLATLREDVRVAGVVVNRAASERHAAMVRAGLAEAGLPVLGLLPRTADITLPARHLGLVQAGETVDLAGRLATLGRLAEAHLDLDAMCAAARPAKALPAPDVPPAPPGQRVALARDAAFSFTYPHLLAAWREAGAEILPFSPLADEAPDETADCCWLPGGYPELHAGALAAAGRFRGGLASFARTRPVHGECGGYMALGAGLVDVEGRRHAMAGLLGLETSFEGRRLHLGYRRARLSGPVPGHGAGAVLMGHEFHYARVLAAPDTPLAEVTDAAGRPVPEAGARRGRVTGSFFHMIAAAP